jgi:putative resolvase
MEKLLSIKETAEYLNVSQDTLRKWDRANKLKPLKTAGGHRRYNTDDLDKFIGIKKEKQTETSIVCATYARVSSNEQKQKGDLDRQSQRLSEYCAKHNLLVTHIIKDIGSGLNDNRSGFVKLTDLIINKKVNKLVIEHKDRLTRFQFKFIKKMFESYGCEVIVINGMDVSDTEELAADMMSLLASFSGKYYGRRSAERRKKNKIKDNNK